MSKRDAAAAFRVALGLATLSTAIYAQAPLRLGGEFQINSYTPGSQSNPAAASIAGGDFVITWVSQDQDGAYSGVFGKRFSSAGLAQSVEFRVNSYTPSFQFMPAVARDDGGKFVVVWASYGNDGSVFGIFARRFDAAGTPLAAEFRVNSFTSSQQVEPAVDLDADGDFVVTWTSIAQDGANDGIFAQRFASSGSALGAEFAVNVFTPNAQNSSDVALDADGDFVVAWRSFLQDDSAYGIFTRRFSSAGVAGIELQANSFTTDDQKDPVVASDGDGDFVVVWRGVGADTTGIFGRRFDALGAPLGMEFQVNVASGFSQTRHRIDMDATGGFVVAWQSYQQDGSYDGIFARQFDSLGAPRGGELQVNSYTSGYQRSPAVAVDADGDFVVSWHSKVQDGDSDGVFAQRFSRAAVLDIDGNGDVGALTDGLLVLRFLFGFTGTTLTSGAVGGGCSRCNAAAIEPYLEGLV